MANAATPARLLALEVGRQVRKRQAFASEVLDTQLRYVQLSDSDAAFARVLALGVVATEGTLDEVINRGLSSPSDINDDVRDALRISTYEMLFLNKQPHAAVAQGVELVRSFAPKAAKLANFALRRVSEAVGEFPFGDTATDIEALARSFGFPLWLAEKLIDIMGRSRAEAFMCESNNAAPLYLGVNAYKDQSGSVSEELDQAGSDVREVRLGADGHIVPGALRVRSAASVAQWPLSDMLKEGRVIVSDAAAQAIAYLALPHKDASPVSFLEIGAGRGTKTVLLQSQAKRILGAPLSMTCVDKFGFKANVLKRRMRALSVPVDHVIAADATDLKASLGDACFDGCLVDAPCSGLGTLRRHPEIRWRLQPSDISALATTSLQLLVEAAAHVAKGGRLTYSTCTVTPEENEHVVKAFLESEAGRDFDIVPVELAGEKRLTFQTELAPAGPDAHFACIMQRRCEAS